ncbi:hypothetical protein N656DRAFT_794807 [Canariomyces notabilis]|uniref:Uncharacterized protein n=1 Tax=Canariomyces notabilis TaxID=2074819 RepID=A0AAN6TLY8_9PEZI|nr:hypothetical protein N656DRAFT_794807 [Canariomyces arenarius]
MDQRPPFSTWAPPRQGVCRCGGTPDPEEEALFTRHLVRLLALPPAPSRLLPLVPRTLPWESPSARARERILLWIQQTAFPEDWQAEPAGALEVNQYFEASEGDDQVRIVELPHGSRIFELPGSQVWTAELPDNQVRIAELPDNQVWIAELPDNQVRVAELPDSKAWISELPGSQVWIAKLPNTCVAELPDLSWVAELPDNQVWIAELPDNRSDSASFVTAPSRRPSQF